MEIDSATSQRIDRWLNGKFDESLKNSIRELQLTNPSLLRDSFYTDLTFGTGGLRGIMGLGTNRVNIYTIRRASLGLANYIKKHASANPAKVAIGFDSRHQSPLFATETARVLAAAGIESFLFTEIRPTPFISFACRELNCNAAVMITASHNPAEYNGYKVYWSDGGQVVFPHDKGIIEEVLSIQSYDDIPISDESDPLIHKLTQELDLKYISAIRHLQNLPSRNKEKGKFLKIIYSSLHGAGIHLVPPSLRDWGFTDIELVPKQCIPDGSFPTLAYPNPEYREALSLGIDLLQRAKADIFFATDPDADRLGVVILHKGSPVLLNGNEIASICSWYLCNQLKEKKTLSPNHAIITTIVSTELIAKICAQFHIQFVQVLTGFKYIGEKIHDWETLSEGPKFLFGAEESYGYLVGTQSRDKDAVASSCLIAEIALFAKEKNKTLLDLLHDIYAQCGIFKEAQYSIDFPAGKEGMEKQKQLMIHLRNYPLQNLLNAKLKTSEDYLTKKRKNHFTQLEESINLPTSDVLSYRFDDDSKVVIRPSGTEPKLKMYVGISLEVDAFSDLNAQITIAEKKLHGIMEILKKYLEKTSE